MSKAKRLSRLKTKKDVVNLALENLVKTLNKRSLISLKGKIVWEGNLKEMRKS
ncbi:MAG: type II toxin-antitoxin system VapB family antitoxin [Chlorobi bacterium]|nr:type II toxin-antitoxin system VapB family antitoxin [Chlorobiota bacterium]MCI0716638.1 type II toxin-antitoxin system VapB family antitoxin [Chlorobiota bacterium]